jgi:NitT/TauT family transport system permease protein
VLHRENHGQAVSPTQEIEQTLPETAIVSGAETVAVGAATRAAGWKLRTFLCAPLAGAIALAVHMLVSKGELPVDTHTYSVFLGIVIALSVVAAALSPLLAPVRRWMENSAPIVAAAIVTLIAWEIITAGLHLLPMPYFPSPAGVLQSFVNDRELLFDSTWHSLILLLGGYALGVSVGLVTGICIGWSVRVRYWGMPLLKFIGPIPATAWIPLAMVVSPNAMMSAIGLIALAVWFPVSMLTASGVANTRASFLDVARTLGAKRPYLIFRVAIPAAMPNIFVGLFMGLGASFLTLVVAEEVGVKSGLGWYVSWAQGWAEYGKVYSALVVMAVFFSTIMSLLFKLRDRVLVWQKGMIRW